MALNDSPEPNSASSVHFSLNLICFDKLKKMQDYQITFQFPYDLWVAPF